MSVGLSRFNLSPNHPAQRIAQSERRFGLGAGPRQVRPLIQMSSVYLIAFRCHLVTSGRYFVYRLLPPTNPGPRPSHRPWVIPANESNCRCLSL
jgi:hypothetical protein